MKRRLLVELAVVVAASYLVALWLAQPAAGREKLSVAMTLIFMPAFIMSGLLGISMTVSVILECVVAWLFLRGVAGLIRSDRWQPRKDDDAVKRDAPT